MVEQTIVDGEHQLSALAERFAHWRMTKRHRGDPIPESLWTEVRSLGGVIDVLSCYTKPIGE